MRYHQSVLHHCGQGCGALAKITAIVAAPIVDQVVGGLVGGTQTGLGLGGNKQTRHGYLDFLFNASKGIAEMFGGQKVPCSFKKRNICFG
jgi:hypothetical protein